MVDKAKGPTDTIWEDKLGIGLEKGEFVATRHIVESYSPKRVVGMFESIKKRIANADKNIEQMKAGILLYEDEKKQLNVVVELWQGTYNKAKAIVDEEEAKAAEEAKKLAEKQKTETVLIK